MTLLSFSIKYNIVSDWLIEGEDCSLLFINKCQNVSRAGLGDKRRQYCITQIPTNTTITLSFSPKKYLKRNGPASVCQKFFGVIEKVGELMGVEKVSQ